AGSQIRERVRNSGKGHRGSDPLLCRRSTPAQLSDAFPYLRCEGLTAKTAPNMYSGAILQIAGTMISRRSLLFGAASLAARPRLAVGQPADGVQVIRARKLNGKLMGN